MSAFRLTFFDPLLYSLQRIGPFGIWPNNAGVRLFGQLWG
jgi:hypothetical protein